jgi:Zn-dependent protease with chaperone function
VKFFDAQDNAKRATRWLIVVYILATALIIAGVTFIVGAILYSSDQGEFLNSAVLGPVAILATVLIVGSTLYKTAALSGGGGQVALSMGGTLVPTNTTDQLRRRLRNVVEEMAIASGVPVPEIYVMEAESGINAFAAGFTPGDAAVAVTRGTLELLNREELQGVIAHEFSHILNGDMRLNIRMMGVLFGIMVLGMIGRTILRSGRYSGLLSSRRGRGSGGIVLVGLGLTVLGWLGVFLARLIKAAVSRQREFLADASAVQFTRQTDGIANALKKIGGYKQHSYLQSTDPEEVSHMLFAGGAARFTSLFATHPPLAERIRALDPSFTESDYPKVVTNQVGDENVHEQASGFAGATSDFSGHDSARIEGDIVESVGQPTPAHVGYAADLRRAIPETLYDAAHSPTGAYLLTLALVLDAPYADRQINIIERQLGESRAALVRQYYDELQKIGANFRLPLLEIAFPELKQRPAPKLEYLLDLIRQLVEIDGHIDLREFCYYRILVRHLEQAIDPTAHQKGNRVSKTAARQAAVDIIRIVADQGHENPSDQDAAFNAGISKFGGWADSDREPVPAEQTVEKLTEALDILGQINSAGRLSMLQAVTATIVHDGEVTATEAELLRAVCASLDCPLPPLLSVN